MSRRAPQLLTLEDRTVPAGELDPTFGAGGSALRYTPNAGTAGADSFTYTVADGRGGPTRRPST